ncbi:alpha-L-rhamnosidase C-terminal domain-containing protein [Jiangella gansuensis]|uniref:alpha-L-rhamnosidase-related protein n=1 Tax=Jiangella gansuensis TaxID=281473 RepID=UPI00047DBF92|nr:alpha-L-rhamnosidase C-terminal domain-containing protein [Jiangella gansuensis]
MRDDERDPEPTPVRGAMIARCRESGPDPFPDLPVPEAVADDDASATWYYPWGQFELARLHDLVRRGFEANRHVDYVDNYGDVVSEAEFRWTARTGMRHVRVVTTSGVPPAVVLAGPSAAVGAVEVRVPGGDWELAASRLGAPGRAPHRAADPVVLVRPARSGGLLELPAPVLGRPVLTAPQRPRLSTGESRTEALAAREDDHETRHDLVRRSDGRWTSRHLLGFRYIATDTAADVVVEAQVHPVPRRGAFLCSDERLNQIWSTSAYTLRLCLQELVVDGIKRDRMPWMGDQALSTLTNAYAFADRQAAHDTIVALGQPRYGYVNGIADYSLWWVIACGFYVRHFDASDDVARLSERVQDFLTEMSGYTHANGVLRPAVLPDQFITHVFLDWGVEIDTRRDLTALQVLWWWALRSGARVLAAAGRPEAVGWEKRAADLRAVLVARAWDPITDSWREYLGDTEPSGTPYADFLSVAAGLVDPVPDGMRASLCGAARAGTPFMTAFALRALGVCGERVEAVRRLCDLWGQMLDAGALTFWEEFGDGVDDLTMYGRPFGKSLCHAWSAGPLVLLPELVLGIRPVEDGWKAFKVDPMLGGLSWARAVVPAPGGDIVVDAAPDKTIVDVPPGTVLRHPVRGDLAPGRWELTDTEESAA